MSAPRAVKLITLVLAGAVAVALLLELGTRTLGWGHGTDFDGAGVNQTRTLEAFDAIELRNEADIEVPVGGPQTVTVTAGEQDQPRLVTRVEDHTLIVDSGTSGRHIYLVFGHDQPHARISITVPSLTALHVEGAGRFRLHQLKGASFDFDVEGAGSLVADGAVDTLKVSISGAAKVDAAAVQAHTVDVDVNGVGEATVRAQDALSANVSGIGRIVYLGNPRSVEKHVSGLGSIHSEE